MSPTLLAQARAIRDSNWSRGRKAGARRVDDETLLRTYVETGTYQATAERLGVSLVNVGARIRKLLKR